jgi:hypothetical protein
MPNILMRLAEKSLLQHNPKAVLLPLLKQVFLELKVQVQH